MSDLSALAAKFEKILATKNIDLYDLEYVRESDNYFLRLYILSEDGVGLDMCAEVSNMLSPLVDVEFDAPERYFFEVSSPGIERSIKTEKQFALSEGEKIKLKLANGSKEEGVLKAAHEDGVVFASKGRERKIPYEDIKKANTIFEWNAKS